MPNEESPEYAEYKKNHPLAPYEQELVDLHEKGELDAWEMDENGKMVKVDCRDIHMPFKQMRKVSKNFTSNG